MVPAEVSAPDIAHLLNDNLAKIETSWGISNGRDVGFKLTELTRRASYPALEARIKVLHTYDVPEVVALPIERGSAAYLEWKKRDQ